MARPSDNNAILRYPFETPTQDRSTHPSRVKPMSLTRAWGVDGRFRGSARSFPGFTQVLDIQASPYNGTAFTTLGGTNVQDHPYYHLPAIDNTGMTTIWFAKYLSVQIPDWYIGTETDEDGTRHKGRVLRGFAIAHDYTGDGAIQRGRFTFYFYDTVEGVWAYHDLMREVGDLESTSNTYRMDEDTAWDFTSVSNGVATKNWPYNPFLTDYTELIASGCTYDVASMGNFIYFTITPPSSATAANVPPSGCLHRSLYCGGFGPWPLGVSTAGLEIYGLNTMSRWIPSPIGPPWTKVIDSAIDDDTDLEAATDFVVDAASMTRTAHADNTDASERGPFESINTVGNSASATGITGFYNALLRYRYDKKNVSGPAQLSYYQGTAAKSRRWTTDYTLQNGIVSTRTDVAREPVWGLTVRRRGYRTLDDAAGSTATQIVILGTHFREKSALSLKMGEGLMTAEKRVAATSDDTLMANTLEIGEKEDTEVSTSLIFDPFDDDQAFSPKKIKLLQPYQGTLLRVGSVPIPARPQELFDREEILSWGGLSTFAPEQMKIADSTPLGSSQDEVTLALVTAGDYAFAVGDTSIFRIHRNGNLLAINEIQSLAGGVSRFAAVGVGTSLVYVSPNGLYMVDGSSGDFQLVSAMDRIIQDDWKGTLSDVRMAYDNVLGCLIVLNSNSSLKEAQLLWSDTGFVTGLKDINAKFLTSGIDPKSADNHHAFWITNEGKVSVVNADRGTTSYDGGTEGAITMCGGDPAKTWNGKVGDNAIDGVADATTTTLDILSASYDPSCVGFELYFLSGANIGLNRTISAQSGDGLTFAALPSAPSRGDLVAIAPIYFECVGWPIQLGAAGTDPFQRKTIMEMAVHANLIAGDITLATNVNLYCESLVYARSDLSTPVLGPNKRELVAGQTANFIRTSYPGTLLYPSWRCYLSNVDLELIEGIVHTLVSASSAETVPVGPSA